jgi:hypothetical protein
MEIYYSPYTLEPVRKANNLSDLKPKQGVFLRTDKEGEIADYFPHVALGDQPIEIFLKSFPEKDNIYHQSLLRQLQTKPAPLVSACFFNHQLWQEGEEVQSPVIKYKIFNKEDRLPDEILKSHCRIRLDANGIFENNEIFKFLSKLDIQQISRIDYIEDPSRTTSWLNIPIPTAKDFIESPHFQTLIYKPNRQFLPMLPVGTIFSGYMGSALGSLHAYRELQKRGDLNKYHGIFTPGIYADGPTLFQGNYLEGFIPDQKEIKIYQEKILDQTWSYLCSV